MENKNFESTTSWYQMYFVGLSDDRPEKISIQEDQLQQLCAMVNAPCVISTTATLDPLYLINHKGTTVWVLLFLKGLVNNKSGLRAVSEGKCSLFIPAESVHGAYNGHINWPENLLDTFNFKLRGLNFFIIPFLMYEGAQSATNLSQSLKSPDGKMEIFGVRKFDDSNPASFLEDLCALKDFILQKRPDVFPTKKTFFSRLFGK